MNFILAYTPFAWPSAPPLGISILKSFVQSNSPGTDVKAIDLNLDFFRNAEHFSNLACSNCPAHGFPDCISLPAYLEGGVYKTACDVLSGNTPGFDDPRTHVENYIVVRSFIEQAKKCCSRLLRPYIEGRADDSTAAEELITRHGEMLLAQQPDILGFSTQSDQAHWALALSKWIKQQSPEIRIVIGGYFPSYCSGKAIIEAFSFVDYAVQGEGEKAAAVLCSYGRDPENFRGTGIVHRTSGKIVEEENEPIKNIDDIPFADFSDFDLEKYFTPEPVLPVLASRGCPWGKCAFCAHRANYSKRYRERSAESMALELAGLKAKFGAKHFLFCDEQVGGRRLESLSEKLSPLEIEFGLAGLKPENRVTSGRLAKAHAAGCRWVYLGVESFSQHILERMNKGTNPQDIINVIKSCIDAGITPFNSYIWGFPGQSREEIHAEANLIANEKDAVTLPDDGHPFTLEEGSPVEASPGDFGIVVLGREVMFDAGGNKVFSGTLEFRPASGLTPFQAQNAYRPGAEVPYESHSFWESLLLLSAAGKKLLFDRNEFFESIVDAPHRKMLDALEKKKNPELRNTLDMAACLAAIGDHEKAATLLKTFLKDPDKEAATHVLFALSKSLIECGDFKGALEKLDSIDIETVDKFGKKAAEYFKGLCFERLGDLDNAVKSYKKVVESDDTIISAYHLKALAALGGCLVRNGERKEGIARLLEAREEDSRGTEATQVAFMLSLAYELEGDTEAMDAENRLLKTLM